jgi:hypothetical protein
MIHGDACFAYFNKIWGIPRSGWQSLVISRAETSYSNILRRRNIEGYELTYRELAARKYFLEWREPHTVSTL